MTNVFLWFGSGAAPSTAVFKEQFTGLYTRGSTFTINVTASPSNYRYMFLSAELAQAATNAQYPISFTVNGIAATVAQSFVSRDGNNSASSTSAHTLVRIPSGNVVSIVVSHSYPTNGAYQAAILELPSTEYNLSSSVSGAASSSYNLSIPQSPGDMILSSFTGTYGTTASLLYGNLEKVPNPTPNNSRGNLNYGMAYALAATSETRNVTISHNATDGRTSSLSRWTPV